MLVEFGQGVAGELVGVFGGAVEVDLVPGVRGQRELGVAGQLGEVLVGEDDGPPCGLWSTMAGLLAARLPWG